MSPPDDETPPATADDLLQTLDVVAAPRAAQQQAVATWLAEHQAPPLMLDELRTLGLLPDTA